MSYANREELAAKISFEGGIEPALDYGLTVDDCPEGDTELREAWTVMATAWSEFVAAAEPVGDLLELEL